jgi:hypothetical protein
MKAPNKNALRAAVLIHEQRSGGPCHDLPIYLPEYAWEEVQRLRRQIDRARRRGWHGAANRLTEDLTGSLDDCRRQLETAHRSLQSAPQADHPSNASDIYRDILALHDEFDEVEIDLDEHTLSVTTNEIVLEGISFGRFEIKLDWRRLDRPPAYRVVALEPNPAARSDDITHPHVQDEQLCEGEGRRAVQTALAESRLYDFFVLVSQLLHTYGKGSAYVELAHWFGTPCEDCGECVDADERYCCQHCEITLCSGCAVPCAACGDYFCTGCLTKCAACGEEHCSSCLKTCNACRKRFCENCLEDALCVSCHEKRCEEEESNDDSPEEQTTECPAAYARGGRPKHAARLSA